MAMIKGPWAKRPIRDEISGRPINWDAPTPKSYWSYQSRLPDPVRPKSWSQQDWESFSPGMRREIAADLAKHPPSDDEEKRRGGRIKRRAGGKVDGAKQPRRMDRACK